MATAARSARTAAALADAVQCQPELIGELIAGIGAKQARVKFGAAKALEILSCRSPELVYPNFDFFAAMLGHENQILKWNAMLTLANLARVDGEGKVELILEAFLAPIAGPALITAATAIRGAARIGAAKPGLTARIVREILRVERASYATAECRNVAIGHALDALGVLWSGASSKRAIRAFARRQLGNPRAATARRAERLLRRS